jgi:hypothetical protein
MAGRDIRCASTGRFDAALPDPDEARCQPRSSAVRTSGGDADPGGSTARGERELTVEGGRGAANMTIGTLFYIEGI